MQFVETDAKVIQDQMVQDFESALGEPFYPGDERRIFLQQETPVIVGLKNDINETAKQNLLRYAAGVVLDALGEFHDVSRLPAQKAKVMLRFTLSAAQSFIMTIPAGTRVTPDGKLYFATLQALAIAAGQTTGDVLAESTEGGKAYNDFAPGQIKTIVDPVAYVAGVTNIDTSTGGADIEDDDSFRERIRLAPKSYSTAGPEGAYIYWAKTADAGIGAVSVTSPAPGVVKVVALMADGSIPDQAILDKVEAAVSAKSRRPLTDNVQVAAPTQVIYDIDLTYYISAARQTEEAVIRSSIEGAGGAIDQYQAWQSGALGRAINPDDLRFRILQAGAYRVALTAPVYAAVGSDKVSVIGMVNVVYGGLE